MLLPDITRAVVPPTAHPVGLFKLVPVMVTNVPTGPDDGEKEVMVGAEGVAHSVTTIAARVNRTMNVVSFFMVSPIDYM